MPFSTGGSASGGGGGSGFRAGPETNSFLGAGYAAAEAARDAYAGANADWLAAYDADRSLAITLTNTTPNPDVAKAQIRVDGAWVDLLGAIMGEKGDPPSNADIDARIAAARTEVGCAISDSVGAQPDPAVATTLRGWAGNVQGATPAPTDAHAHFLLTLPAGRVLTRVTSGDGEVLDFTRLGPAARTYTSDFDFLEPRVLFIETASE